MYGARDYLSYLGYGAMQLFQNEILRRHDSFLGAEIKIYRPRIVINIARSFRQTTNQIVEY